MEERIKPLLLVINPKLWNKFKSKTPRDIRLNDAVVELIEREVNK